VRVIQRTQFCAKNVKNDLKPTDSLKRKFYFETEGVSHKIYNLSVNEGFVIFLLPS
jgi:hypothetical protein